ncbi:MAG: helix-turn-helix domain-containing protein [Clostridiales bacterium]|nr:helix-turn-helix domain-containing protein [Clostridiales bacterium]
MKKKNHIEFRTECGKRILQMRTRREYSRGELAVLAGISSKFLYEIEMGKKGCSSYVMFCLADALGVSVDYLLDTGTEDFEVTEDLCRHFHGSQKDSLDLIIRQMYEMIQSV